MALVAVVAIGAVLDIGVGPSGQITEVDQIGEEVGGAPDEGAAGLVIPGGDCDQGAAAGRSESWVVQQALTQFLRACGFLPKRDQQS